MVTTTRSRIIDYLRKQQAASVQELSRALGLTGADIRHHLQVLRSMELVDVLARTTIGRGRPKNVYGLSRRVLGDGMDLLTATLMDLYLGEESDEHRDDKLRKIGKRIGRNFGINPAEPSNIKLNHVVEFLNSIKYQAHWEAGGLGAEIIVDRCPYASVVAKHPELCRADVFLLEYCLGKRVSHSQDRHRLKAGVANCVFVVL